MTFIIIEFYIKETVTFHCLANQPIDAWYKQNKSTLNKILTSPCFFDFGDFDWRKKGFPSQINLVNRENFEKKSRLKEACLRRRFYGKLPCTPPLVYHRTGSTPWCTRLCQSRHLLKSTAK